MSVALTKAARDQFLDEYAAWLDDPVQVESDRARHAAICHLEAGQPSQALLTLLLSVERQLFLDGFFESVVLPYHPGKVDRLL